jgi:hypothetical protein
VAVALDEPGAVVAVHEAGHGLVELVDRVVELHPQALVFQGADPLLGAAVELLWSSGLVEGGVVGLGSGLGPATMAL